MEGIYGTPPFATAPDRSRPLPTAPDSRLLGRNVSVSVRRCVWLKPREWDPSGVRRWSRSCGGSEGSPWRVILTDCVLCALAGLQSISMTAEKTVAGEMRSAMECDPRRTNQVGAP